MNNIIDLKDRKFFLAGDTDSYEISVELLKAEDGISEYEIKANTLNENGGVVTLKWYHHMVGCISLWAPIADRERAVRQAQTANDSNMYRGAPVVAVVDGRDTNFSTVALSDAVNQMRIQFCVRDFEQQENVEFMLTMFNGWNPGDDYSCILRIDERKIAYYDAISGVTDWWRQFYPITRQRTVNGELPLYSTWYNFHQNPTQEMLEKELEEAAKLGFKSFILDDGWSYEGMGTKDYRFCGNWKFCESKFPDFNAFVDKAHSLGIKVMLWFPVTLIGWESPDYPKFKNKLLYDMHVGKCGVVDPRYPEIREYIVNTYIEFVKKYNLDGLKLDFIDSLKILEPEHICQNPDPGRDTESVSEGASILMESIRSSLTSDNPDFMIELRQRYVGPAITGYCNMLRVLDCAFDTLTNRIGIADLRMMNYDLAVHADMLLWAKDETPVNCAKMLLNTLFGVPQISVILQNSTQEQKKIIKAYIDYWYKNREILLYGYLKAPNPQCFYTSLSSENDDKIICALYIENNFEFSGKRADVFNATSGEFVYIENNTDSASDADIYNIYGEKESSVTLTPGVNKISVPVGGRICM